MRFQRDEPSLKIWSLPSRRKPTSANPGRRGLDTGPPLRAPPKARKALDAWFTKLEKR